MTAPAPEDPEDLELTSVPRALRMLGRSPEEDEEDPALQDVVDAVRSLVPTWRERPAAGWAAHHQLGATMLAVRLYRLKDSPGGMAELAEGGAVYVSGNWPQVAMLLGLGSYAVGRPG